MCIQVSTKSSILTRFICTSYLALSLAVRFMVHLMIRVSPCGSNADNTMDGIAFIFHGKSIRLVCLCVSAASLKFHFDAQRIP